VVEVDEIRVELQVVGRDGVTVLGPVHEPPGVGVALDVVRQVRPVGERTLPAVTVLADEPLLAVVNERNPGQCKDGRGGRPLAVGRVLASTAFLDLDVEPGLVVVLGRVDDPRASRKALVGPLSDRGEERFGVGPARGDVRHRPHELLGVEVQVELRGGERRVVRDGLVEQQKVGVFVLHQVPDLLPEAVGDAPGDVTPEPVDGIRPEVDGGKEVFADGEVAVVEVGLEPDAKKARLCRRGV